MKETEETSKAGKTAYPVSLWEQLKLSQASFPCVIAVVGSGGKTSFMGQLAEEGKAHGLRVAVTTTTHIRKPPIYQETFSGLAEGTIAIFGRECEEEKLSYPGDDCYRQLCGQADLILVEADGSRGLPIKYPAGHEPAIPANVNLILCVCGMSGLGKPCQEVCQRWEPAEDGPKAVITEELLTELLECGYGKTLEKRYPKAGFYYCMNQADTKKQRRAAVRILGKTGRNGFPLSLKGRDNILYRKIAFIYLASGFGRRYGSNKLLEIVDGKPLFCHGLEALLEAAGKLRTEEGIAVEILVVSQYSEILEASERLKASIDNDLCDRVSHAAIVQPDISVSPIPNPYSSEGITASVRLGVRRAERADAYLFAAADQPWLLPASIRRLTEAFYRSPQTIACLASGERRGNPAIFSARYREELLKLTGDRGGNVIMKRYPREVQLVQAAAAELKDIDSKEDL